MKLYTEVETGKSSSILHLSDKTVVLGCCFADSLAEKLSHAGFDILSNPFGTLYNPGSLRAAVDRLDSGVPFGEKDCVEMGAGAGKTCSFHHHTRFARPSPQEFLENANSSLREAAAFWKEAGQVILSLCTAAVWEHDGEIVANCLKRPSKEFTHRLMELQECRSAIEGIISRHPEKHFTVIVSPIRILNAGAHTNSLSKATLQLALKGLDADYFPAWEIMNDKLRDYRFYADDLVHPGSSGMEILWRSFLEFASDPSQAADIEQAEKAFRSSQHRQQ